MEQNIVSLTDTSLTKLASGLGKETPSIRPKELQEREREREREFSY